MKNIIILYILFSIISCNKKSNENALEESILKNIPNNDIILSKDTISNKNLILGYEYDYKKSKSFTLGDVTEFVNLYYLNNSIKYIHINYGATEYDDYDYFFYLQNEKLFKTHFKGLDNDLRIDELNKTEISELIYHYNKDSTYILQRNDVIDHTYTFVSLDSIPFQKSNLNIDSSKKAQEKMIHESIYLTAYDSGTFEYTFNHIEDNYVSLSSIYLDAEWIYFYEKDNFLKKLDSIAKGTKLRVKWIEKESETNFDDTGSPVRIYVSGEIIQ
jgi:hypothetical protein